MHVTCVYCSNEVNLNSKTKFINIVTKLGESKRAGICSKECFNNVKDKNIEIHLKRYNEIKNQEYY